MNNDASKSMAEFKRAFASWLARFEASLISGARWTICLGPPSLATIQATRKRVTRQGLLLYLYRRTEDAENIPVDMANDDVLTFGHADVAEAFEALAIFVRSLPGDDFSTIFVSDDGTSVVDRGELTERIKYLLQDKRVESRDRLRRVRHGLINLPQILRTSHGGEPVFPEGSLTVVCGAGPSLSSLAPVVARYRDRCVVVACGHAVPVLMANGVVPDLIVELDMSAHLNWNHDQVPATTLMAPPELSPPVAGRFERVAWMSGASTRLNQFLANLGVSSTRLAVSRNVMISAIDAAIKGGASSIALIGQDLRIDDDGRSHAGGESDISLDDALVKTPGRDGREVWTTPIFKESINALNAYLVMAANETPVFNCSPDGALVENAPFADLNDLLAAKEPLASRELFPESTKEDKPPEPSLILKELEAFVDVREREKNTLTTLRREVSGTRPDLEKIKAAQEAFGELSRRETELRSSKCAPIDAVAVDEARDGLQGHVGFRSPHSGLLEQVERMLFRHDLIHGVLSQLVDDFKRSLEDARWGLGVYDDAPLATFSVYRRLNANFVKRSHKRYGDGLLEDRFPVSDRFDVYFTHPAPHARLKRPGNSPLALSNLQSMSKSADEEIESFVSNHPIDSTTVVFVAPGNWIHPIRFARRHPNVPFIVVDPWPELTSIVFAAYLVTHQFHPDTAIVGKGLGLDNWTSAFKKALDRARRTGREPALFVNPRLTDLEEIQELLSECDSLIRKIKN